MQDSQLTSSSVYRTLGMGLLAWTPNRARLDNQAKVNAWTAATNDQNQWIQVWRGEGGGGVRERQKQSGVCILMNG